MKTLELPVNKYLKTVKRLLVGVTLSSVFIVLTQHSAFAFKPTAATGHAGATRTGLDAITYATADGTNIRFTPSAIIEVEQANAGVDAGGGFLATVPHCDAEELIACSARLIELRTNTVAAVSDPDNRDGEAARRFLGQALHTLQDFYSHSNWVNAPGPSNTGVNADLGENIIPQLILTQETCENDILNDNVLILFGLTRITSGYFDSTPAGKCAHGIIPDAGIHKDSPGRPFYPQAFPLAIQSTTNYTNLIVGDLAGDDEAVRTLFGLGSTIGFIIDDTGSMGPEISGVKSVIGNIVSTTSTASVPPSDYLESVINFV